MSNFRYELYPISDNHAGFKIFRDEAEILNQPFFPGTRQQMTEAESIALAEEMIANFAQEETIMPKEQEKSIIEQRLDDIEQAIAAILGGAIDA